MIGGVIKTFTVVPAGEIVSAPPVEPISFATAVSLMVGSFIVGVSIVQDFTRYSKIRRTPPSGIVLGFTGYPRSSDLRWQIFARAFQSNDLTNTLINVLGFYIAAFIVIAT